MFRRRGAVLQEKRQIRQEACACLKSYADRSAVGKIKKPQYNRWLNYAGDQSLLNQIEGIEKAFVPVRKKVSKEEYIEQFQQLFRLKMSLQDPRVLQIIWRTSMRCWE